ncbi:hypothetical protein NMG29_04930 [Streptomyces cocklensis]|jgi:hypothetical protein|uniref:Uncharacterized protein n=1 Tax=Actinacidiphila cocklensis TaxID=887465 RepID=A0A9W4GQW1_9ACTN|nr:hypothetical protein [Actinacidiphila cocklensis]MDD1057574.1 hypothetical protein [Actinacidiphila cocklensis]WSX78909.1 hypothetical protein OH826_36700 [Streptomyces sp. NBC_00899]CAG6393797.1 conserved hypothetical protein [Actinacidiphila cocklensis]
MPEFEDALSTALRQAAESVLPDRPLRLVSEAHAQGRRTRRRRKLAMVTTAAAVAAALAVGGTVVAMSGSDGHRTDTMVADPPPAGQGQRDVQMSNALTALLTPGTLTGIRPEDSIAKEDEKAGIAPAAGVAAKFSNSRGVAVVSVFVTRKPAGAGLSRVVCPPGGSGGSDGPCHIATFKDGRVMVSQSIQPAPKDWLGALYETAGYQVTVIQDWLRKPGTPGGNSPKTDAPLTVAQLTSIAQSDLWRTIAAGMPVPPGSATVAGRFVSPAPWS